MDYSARLDDGRQIVKSTASFKIGAGSASVCAVLEEVAPGMRLGDTRRVRAPPSSRKGPRVLAAAPDGQIIEYDVTLTGVVSHMRIHTISDTSQRGDDPLTALMEAGKRLVGSLTSSINAKKS